MTYDEYKKYQIFEAKRINLNNALKGIYNRETKKRIGKILSFYNKETDRLQQDYESLESKFAVNHYANYIYETFMYKIFKDNQNHYYYITDIENYSTGKKLHSNGSVTFKCEALYYNGKGELVFHENAGLSLEKGKRGRVINPYKTVSSNIFKNLKKSLEHVNELNQHRLEILKENEEMIKTLQRRNKEHIEGLKFNIDYIFPEIF